MRLQGEWIPSVKKVKVLKKVGKLPSFIGSFEKTILYLKPEEALFLLEMVSTYFYI